MNECFFMSNEIQEQVLQTISKLEKNISNQTEIDLVWADVKTLFLNELSTLPTLPTSNSKKSASKFKKCKSFWNPELEKCWKNVCSSEKEYLSFKITQNSEKFIKNNLKINFKDAQKTFDSKFRFFKRKHKKLENYNLEQASKFNPREMWDKLNRLSNPPSSKVVLEIVRDDETISTDLKEILTRWHRDISGLFAGLRDNPEFAFDDEFYQQIKDKKDEFESFCPPNIEQPGPFDSTKLNSEILYAEVSKCIDNAKSQKAYLEIPNEALKNPNAKNLLYKFFNICFSAGLNPTEWDKNDIKPIPKKDKDPRDPLQNRCITIMCCVAKIYSSILTRRLQSFLETNKILVEEQNGFRASRSCVDHILVLCTVLRNRKSLGLSTFLAFIDFKKAFDSVDRSLLLYKLAQIGVNGNFYRAISAMYLNPQSRVILNDYETDYFDCPIGVKQGDCISATLFAIFINDLATEIKDSGIGINLNEHSNSNNNNGDANYNYNNIQFINILLYADDIVLLTNNENDLQHLLLIVENWCRKWRLEVNLTKTNVMHVRPIRKQQSKFMFLFNQRPVEYCSYYKYLGTTINQHLDFNYTAETLSDSAGRALGSIITKLIKNGGFPYNVFTTLVDCCVNSISQYASEVWGFEQYEPTLKIHLRAARFYLGLPKTAAIPAVLAQIDWLEPVFCTQMKMIRQYHRIIKMDNTRLTKSILIWDKQFFDEHKFPTWSSEICSIFENYDMNYFSENLELFPLKETIKTLKTQMKLKHANSLNLRCQRMPKLRTFIKFKDFSTTSSFLLKPLSFIQRKYLNKFCLSCLELKIESGRYLGLPENKRICEVHRNCLEQAQQESESHFLLFCPAYSNLRQTWLSKLELPEYFEFFSPDKKLCTLINDVNNVKQTAQFIIDAFNLRSKIINLKK